MANIENPKGSKSVPVITPGVASLEPNLKIATTPFNGQNYLTWSQAVSLYLKGRGKMGHLDGRVTAPAVTDPGYDKWEVENSIIMAWLINSMVPEIGAGFYRLLVIFGILFHPSSLGRGMSHKSLSYFVQ